MLSGVRYFFSDLAHWLSQSLWRPALVLGALAALGAAGVGGYLLADSGSDTDRPPAPAPEVVVPRSEDPDAAEELGFPAFATANTTRVSGADAIANAAGVALAAFPSTGGVSGPDAVTLVDAADWHAGIAASSLVASPVGAPILITEGGDVPDLTGAALAALAPSGSPTTDDQQAFLIGDAADPGELDALAIEGENPAEVAAEVERLRARLVGEPDHILLASSDEPAFAMPAAGWAARSGDPVLFVQRESIPAPTQRVLERHSDVPVYVLGPSSVVSQDVLEEVREVAPGAERVAGDDPVANAIAFARYADGSFGWDINDPGHGLVIANASEPLDAAVASPLSAGGSWGPLLLTEDAGELPAPLRAYLLDLKPGYEDDPTRAVYNHAWLIGDPRAISVEFQAQVDELVELVQIGSGRDAAELDAESDEPQEDDEE